MKDSTQHAHGALQPLPVPPVQFYSYTFDFITNLPPAWGFNCVLTIFNCLIKFTHLIPCTMGEDKLSAAQVAKLLFENIVRFFGVPKELVHDRDPRFTAHLWPELWYILGTKTGASTAFHLRLMGKVSAPIARSNKSYIHTFTTNLCQHG